MNIRTLTTIAAGLALMSAIVTVNLWRELRTEREQTAAVRTQLAESAGRPRVAMAPAPRSDAVTPVPAAAPDPAITATRRPATPPPAIATSSGAFPIVGTRVSEQDLLNDPEYRKARLASLRLTIAQSYPGLAEELKLTSEEADRLFALLAESQMAQNAQASSLSGNQPPDAAAVAKLREDRMALQRQQADSLRAFLGEARYSQWLDYQPTRSSRMQASTYASTLAQAGAPLSSAQLNTLVAAVSTEQKNLQRDTVALGRMVDPKNPQSQAQAQQALRQRQEESSQRMLDAAAAGLSAQQLGILRTQLEQDEAITRATARARERAQAMQPPQ